MIYTSEQLSLAVLETLVHVTRDELPISSLTRTRSMIATSRFSPRRRGSVFDSGMEPRRQPRDWRYLARRRSKPRPPRAVGECAAGVQRRDQSRTPGASELAILSSDPFRFDPRLVA